MARKDTISGKADIANCKLQNENFKLNPSSLFEPYSYRAICNFHFAIFNFQCSHSDRRLAAFFSSNPNHIIYGENKDFAISKFAGAGRFNDRVYHKLFDIVGDKHFNLDLWHEFNLILSAAVRFGVSALPAIALNFSDSHAVYINLL